MKHQFGINVRALPVAVPREKALTFRTQFLCSIRRLESCQSGLTVWRLATGQKYENNEQELSHRGYQSLPLEWLVVPRLTIKAIHVGGARSPFAAGIR
jgi:hypothetical protein